MVQSRRQHCAALCEVYLLPFANLLGAYPFPFLPSSLSCLIRVNTKHKILEYIGRPAEVSLPDVHLDPLLDPPCF